MRQKRLQLCFHHC
ncbi:MAG TPA: hypothetical protein DGJ56_06160 [Verrucomicrobiales bacterium]|nr:hypothetical protein [Verrucomicrobiales bacterium]